MTQKPAVHLQAVTKRFGAIEVVKGVDLTIERGEFLTLLGASGCGKTTLLRMIAGFEQPSTGKVLIAGEDVTKLPPYKRKIGMVFQGLALFPHLSVGDNVGFGLDMRRVPKAERGTRIAAALEMVGLAGYGGRATSQMSGGQRQRVALARSLVTEPEVLLLDEPLSALDLKLRRQMQEELKAIQARTGATFVFVTHDQEEAVTMSDRIAVIREGRLAQLDTAREVYEYPHSAFVANTLGEANIFNALLEGGQVVVPDLGVSLPAPRAYEAGVAAVVRPEKVAINPPHTHDITVEAVVESATFAGSVYALVLTAQGRSLRARIPVGPLLPQPGESVRAGWQSSDMTFVDAA